MISEKVFNDLKKARKILIDEINFNKEHNLNSKFDFDFDCGNNGNLLEVADVMRNKAILSATNMKWFYKPVKYQDNDILVAEHNNNASMQVYLNVKGMLRTVNHLIKLGRKGISKLAEQNEVSA